MGCFHVNHMRLWEPQFDRNSLTRWCRKGLLVKLRNEWYAFAEYKQLPGFERYIANRICAPSYISLQTALSFYGMIPEEVLGLTCVTTLKTSKFKNSFGTFTYQNVKESLFFGYQPKTLHDGRAVLFATPEKALIDLLYLYPFYRSEGDMEQLRLDEDYMQTQLNQQQLELFVNQIGSRALERRTKLMLKVYGL